MPQLEKVTVVVINHNYGAYVRHAIDSALSQTWQGLEVIVVDDGSSDNSREEIAKYGSRIKPVFQEQGGHTCAVNAGFHSLNLSVLMQKAKGVYFRHSAGGWGLGLR